MRRIRGRAVIEDLGRVLVGVAALGLLSTRSSSARPGDTGALDGQCAGRLRASRSSSLFVASTTISSATSKRLPRYRTHATNCSSGCAHRRIEAEQVRGSATLERARPRV
jgi:hypothetical protein